MEAKRVVLSDMFGIQARGGCSCAGRYGHRLLHITDERSAAVDAEVARGRLGVKPRWARIGFNYKGYRRMPDAEPALRHTSNINPPKSPGTKINRRL